MAFASAISLDPVSAYATGEVIGQVLDTVGPHPDLVVVLARPGHAGALEDIAGTIHRILAPSLLIGGVSEGVGTNRTFVRAGPALALLACRCGPLTALGPQPPLGVATSTSPGVGTTLLLTTAAPEDDAAPPSRHQDRAAQDLVSVAPTIGGVVRGPLVLGDAVYASGSVGVTFGANVDVRPSLVSDLGPVGPVLTVTAAASGTLIALDGVAAIERLTTVVRDHVPAGALADVGRSIHLGWNGQTTPARVLGVDPSNGAVAVACDYAPQPGATVVVHVAAPSNIRRNLRSAMHMTGPPAGSVIFAAPGHGPVLAGQAGDDDLGDGGAELDEDDGPLPAATLSCEAAPRIVAPLAGIEAVERASALAIFPQS